MARRKRKTNVQLPREKEEILKKELRENIEHVIFTLSDIEMDDEIREDLIETLSDLDDVTTALLNDVRIPKRGLRYPWKDVVLS